MDGVRQFSFGCNTMRNTEARTQVTLFSFSTQTDPYIVFVLWRFEDCEHPADARLRHAGASGGVK